MIYKRFVRFLLALLILSGLTVLLPASMASAVVNPQSGSIGLQGTLNGPPPSQGATIGSPPNGQTYTSLPITVSGTCPTGTLVKVFSNGVFVGAEECTNGAYSIQIDLFNGSNALTALDYDALNQSGPATPTVNVTYTNTQFSSFGTPLTLTSSFAEKGANPGQSISWPIILNGGQSPYAISVDWGDGQPAELLSESSDGTVNISHTYASAGTYKVIVKATDTNGETAFLQLVGVANGPIAQSNTATTGSSGVVKTIIIWWPAALAIPFVLIAFWLGRRYENRAIRRRVERQ